jgi:hypothetical protein
LQESPVVYRRGFFIFEFVALNDVFGLYHRMIKMSGHAELDSASELKSNGS